MSQPKDFEVTLPSGVQPGDWLVLGDRIHVVPDTVDATGQTDVRAPLEEWLASLPDETP